MESNYKVGFSDEALKDLKKLTKVDVQKVLGKLNEISNFRRNNNVKKLAGELGDYFRLRVGKIRVIFEVDEINKQIKIVHLGFRGGIYC